jgi:ribonuclease HI
LRDPEGSGCPIEILSVCESNVRTPTKYLPRWKSNGWRNRTGKPPANLDLWKEYDQLSATNEIKWTKREVEIPGMEGFGQLEDAYSKKNRTTY